jgi:beta-galactosidase
MMAPTQLVPGRVALFAALLLLIAAPAWSQDAPPRGPDDGETDPSDGSPADDAPEEVPPAGVPDGPPGAPPPGDEEPGEPAPAEGEPAPAPASAATDALPEAAARPAVVRMADGGGNVVTLYRDDGGWKLQADGEDLYLFGMNWGYVPIGENYSYDFWAHDDDWIKRALAPEMELLQNMGINTIRQYYTTPPRWVTYIYETYGIWTMVNHTVARYGFDIDGKWVPVVDYSDARVREVVKADVMRPRPGRP